LRLSLATRISLIYAAAGTAWIVLTDVVAARLLPAAPDLLHGHLLKGLAFVAVTALVLRAGLGRAFRALKAQRAEAQAKAAALKLSEERYRALADLAPVGIYHLDRDGNNAYANARMAEITGRTAAEMAGRGWEMTIHPEDRAAIVSGAGEDFAATVPRQREFRVMRPDGGVRWIITEAVPVRGEGRELLGYVGIAVDITDRHLAAEAARRTAERLELALEGSAVGVWDWNMETGAVYWSPELRRLLRMPDDRPAEALADHAALDIVHPDDRDAVRAATEAHFRTREPFDYEYRLRGGDGQYRWFHGRGTSQWNGSGGPLRMLGSLTEITTRREAATQLASAREAAELANRAKTAFLASMSHELRTPLNAIIGFSELIAGETFGPAGDPRYVEYAEDIQASGRHLMDLLTHILDAARLESGPTELREERVQLEEEVAAAIRQSRAAHRDRDVAVEPRLEGTSWLVADRRALRQMLLNVVGNAIKYTPDGGRVTVRVETGPAGLNVVVSDTGPGFAEEVLRTVGQPFLQGDASLRRQHGGSGLGLFVVRRLLEQHGGALEIGAAPGGGALVRLRFPPDRVAPVGPRLPLRPSTPAGEG